MFIPVKFHVVPPKVTDCKDYIVTMATDVCNGVTCQNGGTCEGTGSSYQCRCAQGYIGAYCDVGKYKRFMKGYSKTQLFHSSEAFFVAS